MKISATLKIVAMIFIFISTVILLLTVFEVINSEDTKEMLVKLAAACGIIGVASLGVSLLSKD